MFPYLFRNRYLCTKFGKTMKKLTLFLTFILALFMASSADAARPRPKAKARTHRVIKHRSKHRKTRRAKPKPPTIHENPYRLCEDTCKHIHGIDMSHYQGEVFWDAIGHHSGISYVYLKATEGGDRIDSRYEQNIFMAHQRGIKVGSYHFFRPKTDLALQLENFRTQCLASEQDLIPMLDVESTGGLGREEFCDSLIKFLRFMEDAYHQKPLIYTGKNFYNKYLIGRLNDYKLMIAMYTDEEPVLADERDICLWQYTGRGTVRGVRGHIDKSRFMGKHSLEDLKFIK